MRVKQKRRAFKPAPRRLKSNLKVKQMVRAKVCHRDISIIKGINFNLSRPQRIFSRKEEKFENKMLDKFTIAFYILKNLIRKLNGWRERERE